MQVTCGNKFETKVRIFLGIVQNKGLTKANGVEVKIKLDPVPDCIFRELITVPKIKNIDCPIDIEFGPVDIKPHDEEYFSLCHSAPDYNANEMHIYKYKSDDQHLHVEKLKTLSIYIHSNDPLTGKNSWIEKTLDAEKVLEFLQIKK